MSVMGYYIVCAAVLGLLGLVKPECYTSVYRTTQAVEQETSYISLAAHMLDKVDSDVIEEPAIIEFKSFITRASETNKISSHQQHYMENPINIFHLVRRLAMDWKQQIAKLDDVIDTAVQDFVKDVKERMSTSDVWPNDRDVTGTAIAFIRLRNTYYISFDELLTGTLNGTLSENLTIVDMYEIARTAHEKSLYFESVEWFNFIIKALSEKLAKSDLNIVSVIRSKAAAYQQFGDIKTAIEVLEDGILSVDEDNDYTVKLMRDLKLYQSKAKQKTDEEKRVKVEPLTRVLPATWTKRYEALCRNDHKKSKWEVAKLKCYHRKTQVPYRPADVEVVNISPEICLFHRVIHNTEIEGVINRAKAVMKRSVVVGLDGAAQQATEDRVSQSGWLEDTDPLIYRLSKRVELLTGLSTKLLPIASHAEQLQVLNYGIGGMYNPHHDYFDETHHKWNMGIQFEGSGNRIATWMFYLSEVSVGGATVFPNAGAHVPIVKGGAAFWYNLHRNGKYDLQTLHAGCPVLMGSKWVSNKWTHERAQLFRRRCSLDKNQ